MKFGSLFAGIGGFDLGFERAGMTAAWQSEIQPNCKTVLDKHWPEVPLYDDIQALKGSELPAADVICGGFPCQDVSLAGRREGLAGERSGLWFEFHRILEEHRPDWAVIENVPGLLSSNAGEDFATILRGLEQLGYGVAWRLLDAQNFGVPQRRRRLIIVGHTGDFSAVQVLFEPESLPRDFAPKQAARQASSSTIGSNTGGGRRSTDLDQSGPLIAVPLLGQHGLNQRAEMDNLMPTIFRKTQRAHHSEDDEHWVEADVAPTLDAIGHGPRTASAIIGPVTAKWHKGTGGPSGDEAYNLVYGMIPGNSAEAFSIGAKEDVSPPARGGGGGVIPTIAGPEVGVRRLMPLECERLQGFPDGWTDGHSDTQRYRMIGNAVAVPVAEWLGRRLMAA